MWSWKKKICLVQFYLKKNQKNALWNSFRDGFFSMEPKQPERKHSSYKGKYAQTGKFLKLFVHKKTQQLVCLVTFKVAVLAQSGSNPTAK